MALCLPISSPISTPFARGNLEWTRVIFLLFFFIKILSFSLFLAIPPHTHTPFCFRFFSLNRFLHLSFFLAISFSLQHLSIASSSPFSHFFALFYSLYFHFHTTFLLFLFLILLPSLSVNFISRFLSLSLSIFLYCF